MSVNGVAFHAANQYPWQPIQSVQRHVKDLNQAIQRYDRMASDSFTDQWAQSSAVWGARVTGSYVGEKYLPQIPFPFREWGLSKLDPLAKDYMSYNRLLGIGSHQIGIGSPHYFTSYRHFLASPEKWEAWQTLVKANFKHFLKPNLNEPAPFRARLHQTAIGYNAEFLAKPLREKHFYGATLNLLAVGLLLKGIVSKSHDAFVLSRNRGDGLLKTLGHTLATFLAESAKGAVSWELGTIGFSMGVALLPIGILPAIVAGIITGGLFGSLGYHLLNKVIPEPPKTPH